MFGPLVAFEPDNPELFVMLYSPKNGDFYKLMPKKPADFADF